MAYQILPDHFVQCEDFGERLAYPCFGSECPTREYLQMQFVRKNKKSEIQVVAQMFPLKMCKPNQTHSNKLMELK